MSKTKKLNWGALLSIGVALIGLIFGGVFALKYNKAEEARIEAQNTIAEQSETIQEAEGIASRLATQYEDLQERLRESNERLADLIDDRGEEILSLTRAIANLENIRVVVRNPVQVDIEAPDGSVRTRVDFDQEVDPIRVSGFTLTNPAQAELEVAFTRPLNLTSVVTQQEDGSWRSYIESDWPNLEISSIETSVNPLRSVVPRFRERVILGGHLYLTPNRAFDSGGGHIYMLFESETKRSLAIGPSVGISSVGGASRYNVGLQFQWRPWGNRRR